jgi:hypothetical protein
MDLVAQLEAALDHPREGIVPESPHRLAPSGGGGGA